MPYFAPWVPNNFEMSDRTLILLDRCRRGRTPHPSPSGWGDPFDKQWPEDFVRLWIMNRAREDQELTLLFNAFKAEKETPESFWNRFAFSFLVPGVVENRRGKYKASQAQLQSGILEFKAILATVQPNRVVIAGNDFVWSLQDHAINGLQDTNCAQAWRLDFNSGNYVIPTIGLYSPTAWASKGFNSDEWKSVASLLPDISRVRHGWRGLFKQLRR